MNHIKRIVVAGVVCVIGFLLLYQSTSAATGTWVTERDCYGAWPFQTCVERTCYRAYDGWTLLWESCSPWRPIKRNV